jgi:hypothetical protein
MEILDIRSANGGNRKFMGRFFYRKELKERKDKWTRSLDGPDSLQYLSLCVL